MAERNPLSRLDALYGRVGRRREKTGAELLAELEALMPGPPAASGVQPALVNVQPAPTKAQPAPASVQPAPVNVQPAPAPAPSGSDLLAELEALMPGAPDTPVAPPESRLGSAAKSFVQGMGQPIAAIPKAIELALASADPDTLEAFDEIDRTGRFAPKTLTTGAGAITTEVPQPLLEAYRDASPDERAQLRSAFHQRQADAILQGPLYQAGTAIDDWFRAQFPTDPRYEGEFWADQVPNALGQVVPIAAEVAATRRLPFRGAKALSYGVGAAQGAAMNAPAQFEDALANGADIETALTAAGIGGAVGLTEVIPIGRLFARLDKASGGGFKRKLLKIVSQGSQEAVQEAFVEVMNSASALHLYDPKRGIWTDATTDATAVGFTTGAILEVLASLLPGRKRRAGDQADDPFADIDANADPDGAGAAPSPSPDDAELTARKEAAADGGDRLDQTLAGQEAVMDAQRTQTAQAQADADAEAAAVRQRLLEAGRPAGPSNVAYEIQRLRKIEDEAAALEAAEQQRLDDLERWPGAEAETDAAREQAQAEAARNYERQQQSAAQNALTERVGENVAAAEAEQLTRDVLGEPPPDRNTAVADALRAAVAQPSGQGTGQTVDSGPSDGAPTASTPEAGSRPRQDAIAQARKARQANPEQAAERTTQRAKVEADARATAEQTAQARASQRDADAQAATKAKIEQQAQRRAKAESELDAKVEQRAQRRAALEAKTKDEAEQRAQRRKDEAATREAEIKRRAEQRAKTAAAVAARTEQRAEQSAKRRQTEAATRAKLEKTGDADAINAHRIRTEQAAARDAQWGKDQKAKAKLQATADAKWAREQKAKAQQRADKDAQWAKSQQAKAAKRTADDAQWAQDQRTKLQQRADADARQAAALTDDAARQAERAAEQDAQWVDAEVRRASREWEQTQRADTTPETAPETTPETAPEPTPESAPETAPETTPENTPPSAPKERVSRNLSQRRAEQSLQARRDAEDAKRKAQRAALDERLDAALNDGPAGARDVADRQTGKTAQRRRDKARAQAAAERQAQRDLDRKQSRERADAGRTFRERRKAAAERARQRPTLSLSGQTDADIDTDTDTEADTQTKQPNQPGTEAPLRPTAGADTPESPEGADTPESPEDAEGTEGTEDTSTPNSAEARVERAAGEAQTSPDNDLPPPTPGQIEAGNYQKGHVTLRGHRISIENPKGSTRSSQPGAPKAWSQLMAHHYGYLRGTRGADGDHVDVFIGDDIDAPDVYVVDQIDQDTGRFDEHKVMLGFKNANAARRGYQANYEKGHRVGPIRRMTDAEFSDWLDNGDTTKPANPNTPVGGATDAAAAVPRRPRNVRRRTSTPAAKGLDAAAVTEEVDRLTADLPNVDVTVVATENDLPEHLRPTGDQAQDGVRALYDIGNDQVYVVADQHTSPDDVRRTLLHEAVAHKGLRALFTPEELNALLDDVAANADRGTLERIAQRYGLDLTNPRERREATEEYIAQTAESGIDANGLQRAVAAVRRVLRRMGLAKTWTDNDIKGLLREAHTALAGTPARRTLIEQDGELRDTGEPVTITTPADRAIRQLDKRRGVLQALRDCVQ